MSIYAIGDIQGCLDQLLRLLDKVQFNPDIDQLWFTGDLVNRGPKSLETLQFVRSLGSAAVTVLGNHDLHLLALAEGDKRYTNKFDTLLPIIESNQRDELLNWLRHRPLLHRDKELGYTLIHAGLPPQWSMDEAMVYARELESTLQSSDYRNFLSQMYGNEPAQWDDNLKGIDRLRFITNCFTRLRFCSDDGVLNLKSKGKIGSQPDGFSPWFRIAERKSRSERILFGHWSTLGIHSEDNVYPLDSGCLWGGELTALQIDCNPPKRRQISCGESLAPW